MNGFHIISAVLENKPGVLHRVTNMLRGRAFNIDSISCGTTQQKDLSRATLTLVGDDPTVEQLVKQLAKLIDVIEVVDLPLEDCTYRELALVKIQATDSRARLDVISLSNVFRSRVVDVSPKSVTVEVTGTPDKIDAFIELTEGTGIIAVARTGVTALPRG